MKISKRSKVASSKETADRKTDRRISPTNVRYRGYMIRLDRGGDGYNVYDKHGELEDAGYDSIEKAKEFVDELENESKKSYVRSSIDEDPKWICLDIKYVRDSDGMLTDYALYTTKDEDKYICMFGDADVYAPDEMYADAEFDTEDEALEWFENYVGPGDEEDEDDIYSSEETDAEEDDDLDHPDQEYDSAATSINSTKLPAIYRMIKLQPGTVGVDFGGGKFNNAIDYLRDQDVTLCVYDPYNRSAEHNREVLRTLRANGGADFAINSNVLNVIKEPEARKGVLENIKKITKSGAPIYITVYEGRGDAKEGVTKSGYQLNRKTADYLEEIQEVFPDAKRKGKLIVATNKGSVNSSSSIKASSEIIWDDLDWNQQIQVMKRYIRNYKGARIFEDFADYINKPVEDIIDSFTDAESHEDIKIPERMQLDSEYRNDDIYSSSSVDANTDEYSRVDASSRTVNSSTNIKASSTEGYVYTYCDECGKKNRVKVAFNSFNEPFNDTEYKCKYCGTRNLLTDPHSYDENGNVVEASQSYLDRIEELMEQGLDEDTASREAYAEFYPDEYDADDYDEIYSSKSSSIQENASRDDLLWSVSRMLSYEDWYDDNVEFHTELHKDGSRWIYSDRPLRDNDAIRVTGYIEDILIDRYDMSSQDFEVIRNKYGSGWTILFKDSDDQMTEDVSELRYYIDDNGDEIYSSKSSKRNTFKIISSTTSSNRYWYFTRHGVQPGSVPKYVNILDIVDKPEGSYFLADGVILTKDLRDYDIKERKPEDSVTSSKRIKSKGNNQSHGTVNGSTNEHSDILEEIREQCNTKLIHIMAQYGFDESEAKQYSRVDASIEDNQYGRIEIGCELDYDGLMRVCQELDPIVQAYDPDSYFEPVDSGIAEAWVNLEKASIDSSSNIQAGAYDFPEPSLDPPEYPEPEEVDDYTQKIDLNLDAVIEIDQLGNWEYQDENYPWARCKDTKDGSWYSDEYDVFIADPVSIVERVDELLISKLPEKEGTYRIKGNVHLEYVVSNLSKYVHSYGPDDYDEDIDTDNAYVDFDFYNSNISDFKLTKI